MTSKATRVFKFIFLALLFSCGNEESNFMKKNNKYFSGNFLVRNDSNEVTQEGTMTEGRKVGVWTYWTDSETSYKIEWGICSSANVCTNVPKSWELEVKTKFAFEAYGEVDGSEGQVVLVIKENTLIAEYKKKRVKELVSRYAVKKSSSKLFTVSNKVFDVVVNTIDDSGNLYFFITMLANHNGQLVDFTYMFKDESKFQSHLNTLIDFVASLSIDEEFLIDHCDENTSIYNFKKLEK